jgi:type II secretory pathway pseudopilin PulG
MNLYVIRREQPLKEVGALGVAVVGDFYLTMNGKPVFTPLLSSAHVFEIAIAQAYVELFRKIFPDDLFKIVEMQERRGGKDRRVAGVAGFGLLEMMIAMLVALTLFAIAVPNARTLTLYAQRREALAQVRTVTSASLALANCEAIVPPVACPTPGVIPSPGTLTMAGWSYIFHVVAGTPGTPIQYSSSTCSWPSGMPNQTFSAATNASNGHPQCSSIADGQIGQCVVSDVNSWSPGSNLLTCPSALAVPGTPATFTYQAVPSNGDSFSYWADSSGVLRYDVSPNVAGPNSPLE